MSYPYQIKTLEAYHEAYKNSIDHPEKFWGDIAENFTWRKKWDKVLDWNFTEPKVEWFKGGKLNITALDDKDQPFVVHSLSCGDCFGYSDFLKVIVSILL